MPFGFNNSGNSSSQSDSQTNQSYASYSVPEPDPWPQITGESRQFTLNGNVIHVSANLDTCVKYRPYFKTAATYYKDRLVFQYGQRVTDFDSMVQHFQELYVDGLSSMCERAYSLLLPFGVFTIEPNNFLEQHYSMYHKAIDIFSSFTGIVFSQEEKAKQTGSAVGNSIQMRGFGFGLSGALRGMAKAELFNMGMRSVGKITENAMKMSPAQKAQVYAGFNLDAFFVNIYLDYYKTLHTLVQILVNCGVIEEVSTMLDSATVALMNNMDNPMFPQDQIAPQLAKMVETHPFSVECMNLLAKKIGSTEETQQIIEYFIG